MNKRAIVLKTLIIFVVVIVGIFLAWSLIGTGTLRASAEANGTRWADKIFSDYGEEYKPDVLLKILPTTTYTKEGINTIILDVRIANYGKTSADISLEVHEINKDNSLGVKVYPLADDKPKITVDKSTELPYLIEMQLSVPEKKFMISIDHEKDKNKDDNWHEITVKPAMDCTDVTECKNAFGDIYECREGYCLIAEGVDSCNSNADCSGMFCSAEGNTEGYCLELKEFGETCVWTKADDYDSSCKSGKCHKTTSGKRLCGQYEEKLGACTGNYLGDIATIDADMSKSRKGDYNSPGISQGCLDCFYMSEAGTCFYDYAGYAGGSFGAEAYCVWNKWEICSNDAICTYLGCVTID